ncbi:MAG: hypothetical protein ACFB6R_13855 [Alphaproteobacteria bacterium]
MVTLHTPPADASAGATDPATLPPVPEIETTPGAALERMRLEAMGERTALEAAPRMLALLGPSLDLEAYWEILARFYGFYRGMEPWLAQAVEECAVPLSMGKRWRSPVIEQDLLALGTAHDGVVNLPVCPAPPIPPTLPDGLGMLYVFEILARSMPVVGRHLARTLRVQATGGAAYFAGYGPESVRLWRIYGDVAQKALTQDADQKSAVLSARNTYLALERWLSLRNPR